MFLKLNKSIIKNYSNKLMKINLPLTKKLINNNVDLME
jgi:hypothetical protein